MKLLFTAFFIALFGFASGQHFAYPVINKEGKGIHDFIPNGWTLLDSTQGDLNYDKRNDLVLIIQHKDSVSVITKDADYIDTVITQPRILLILFYNQTTNLYQLTEQCNRFILNHDNPNMDDPYLDISIANNILTISFHIFMNMGGWGMSTNTYKFRYQNNEFNLIGADNIYVHRATGETEDRSYNFLTKKVKIATGNISSEKEKISWKSIKLSKLKTFKSFQQPFTWEVEKDQYL